MKLLWNGQEILQSAIDFGPGGTDIGFTDERGNADAPAPPPVNNTGGDGDQNIDGSSPEA